MKIKRKNLYCIIFLILFVMSILLIFVRYNSLSINKIEKKLYSMSKTITVKELKQSGYIDTTNIQETKNNKIEKFFLKAQNQKKAVLKTFQMQEDKLYVRIFYSDSKLKEISSLTYLPWSQQSISPDKRFNADYKSDKENNIVTVILVNKKNNLWPDDQILIDEILYSYYEK